MSKLIPSITGSACIVWIAGWTWWLSKELNQIREAAGGGASAFSIAYDDFKFAAEDIFHFNHSESVPFLPEDNHPVFKSIASYLTDNKNVTLKLTGVYASDEQNLSAFPNLGLARAEALKTLLVEKGAPKENIQTEAFGADNFFQEKGKLLGGVYFDFAEKTVEPPHLRGAVAEEKTTGSAAFHHVFFYEEGKYVFAKDKKPLLDSLRNFLRSEREKKVILTGFSEPDEEKNSSVRLAEMRAKAVRRYLVDNGVRRSQIEVKSKPGMATGGEERIVTLSVQ
jgi:OmpA-OmpF porin, OOP family